MHQPPHLVRSRCNLVHAGDKVHRLGGAEMMADRANAAKALHDNRHFGEHAALNETFKTAELDDMEAGLLDLASLVEANRDLAMTFDAGDRVDDDFPNARFR